MLTRKRWTPPNIPTNLPPEVQAYLRDQNKSISDYLLSLEAKDSLSIETPQLTLSAATGNAPLIVSSTTKVTNLNADLLDGIDSASFQLASGYTAADVLSKLLTVDGSGSGLDADLLDGLTGAASTYTPGLTNQTNIAASTAYACQYLRLGPVCVVSGKFDADPTAAGLCELGLALPVSSNFTADNQLGGGGAINAGASATTEFLNIRADATNDRAEIRWNATLTANNGFNFIFMYLIL